jgi:RimJ/RimL family protein N-acetyltransferase
LSGKLIGSILIDADEYVSAWVLKRIRQPIMTLGDYTAMGVVRDKERLVAGVIFHNYRPVDGDVHVIVAADDARWCLPKTMRALFGYAFDESQLDCVRMTSVIAKNNKRCRRLCEGMGFRLEGHHRRAIGRKHDAVVYGLMRTECKFIRPHAATSRDPACASASFDQGQSHEQVA